MVAAARPLPLILFLAMLVRAFGDSAFILDGYYNYCFYYFFLLASRFRLQTREDRVPRPEHTFPQSPVETLAPAGSAAGG